MNRLTRLYLTFDKLRAGMSRYGSRRFSAAVTTSLAMSFSVVSVFLSRGVSLAVATAAEPFDFDDFLARFAISYFLLPSAASGLACPVVGLAAFTVAAA